MKIFFLIGFALVLAAPANAQVVEASAPPSVASERARIERERVSENIRVKKAEDICYQRFAVNDCLREVAVQRRKNLEDLRRQEIILDDNERKLRAGDQLQKLDERKAASALAAASSPTRSLRVPNTPQVEQEQQAEKTYLEKQQQAQQRQVERERQLVEKKGRTAKSLPVPP